MARQYSARQSFCQRGSPNLTKKGPDNHVRPPGGQIVSKSQLESHRNAEMELETEAPTSVR